MEVHKISHQRLRHCAFSREEDTALRNLVAQYGMNAWQIVAQHMTRRSARQCRERWYVLVKRANSARPFTPEEDNLLVTKCMQIGPKWHILESFFIDRTRMCLKNRWKTLTEAAEIESKIELPIEPVQEFPSATTEFGEFGCDELDLFTGTGEEFWDVHYDY